MSDERKRGYAPRYVLLKLLVLPEDFAYINQVQSDRALPSRNDAARLVLKEAREAKRFLAPVEPVSQ